MSTAVKHVNLIHLEYFCAVVETGGISAAAKELFISPQAASSSVIKLERELGVRLFDRTPNLVLTEIGKKTYQNARKLLEQRDNLLHDISVYQGAREENFVIGCAPCRAQYIFPRVIEQAQRCVENIHFQLAERLNTEELEKGVLKDEIDFAIGPFLPFSELIKIEEMYEERLSLVIPNNYLKGIFSTPREAPSETFDDKEISVECLDRFPFFLPKASNRNRQAFDAYLSKQNVTLPVILESDNIETLLSFAIRGQCITVFPELLLKKMLSEMSDKQKNGISVFSLKDDNSHTVQSIAYHKKRKITSNERKTIDLLKEVCISTFAEQY